MLTPPSSMMPHLFMRPPSVPPPSSVMPHPCSCLTGLSTEFTIRGLSCAGHLDEQQAGAHPREHAGVLMCFKHEIAFQGEGHASCRHAAQLTDSAIDRWRQATAEPEQFDILTGLLWDILRVLDVSLRDIATQIATMVMLDLVDLVGIAQLVSLKQAMHAMYVLLHPRISQSIHRFDPALIRITEQDLAEGGMMLTGSDLEAALLKERLLYCCHTCRRVCHPPHPSIVHRWRSTISHHT